MAKLSLVYFVSCMSIWQLCAHSNNSEIVFYSQASQDQFVHKLLYNLQNKLDEGFYLEIGAGHPTHISNTYFLEKNFSWKGTSIDILDRFTDVWQSIRTNPLIIEDAANVDYETVLRSFPPVIDYLTLDTDGEYDAILRKIPFHLFKFRIITIEHDYFRYGDVYRKPEREFLTLRGYYLLCPDVALVDNNGNPAAFEDWWICPNEFQNVTFELLKSLDLKQKTHFEIMHVLFHLCQK